MRNILTLLWYITLYVPRMRDGWMDRYSKDPTRLDQSITDNILHLLTPLHLYRILLLLTNLFNSLTSHYSSPLSHTLPLPRSFFLLFPSLPFPVFPSLLYLTLPYLYFSSP